MTSGLRRERWRYSFKVRVARAVLNDASASDGKRSPLFYRALRVLWLLIIDPWYRNRLRMRLLPPKGMFQPFNKTGTDRYPRIFSFVQSELGANSTISILSFGCSTGEEVFSLRRYFPRAVIKGIDVNPRNIAACQRSLRATSDTAITFAVANSTTGEETAAYDAILVMHVLRHGDLLLPGVTRCDHLIRFADFANIVEDFGRCLKPRGLLVIGCSNFRLCDTSAAADFETVLRLDGTIETPIFGPDNRLVPDLEYSDTVFRKNDAISHLKRQA